MLYIKNVCPLHGAEVTSDQNPPFDYETLIFVALTREDSSSSKNEPSDHGEDNPRDVSINNTTENDFMDEDAIEKTKPAP